MCLLSSFMAVWQVMHFDSAGKVAASPLPGMVWHSLHLRPILRWVLWQ